MSLFLKEEDFGHYLMGQHPTVKFTKGKSLVSINIIKMTPLTSCIYLSNDYFFAAKYNRQLGIFNEGLLLNKNQIAKITLTKKGINYNLVIEAKEQLPNGQPLVLTMKLSKLTAISWHKKNLKSLCEDLLAD